MKLISIGEAADRLSLSERTIDRYIESGKLNAVRVGGHVVRLREGDVDRLVATYERRKRERE